MNAEIGKNTYNRLKKHTFTDAERQMGWRYREETEQEHRELVSYVQQGWKTYHQFTLPQRLDELKERGEKGIIYDAASEMRKIKSWDEQPYVSEHCWPVAVSCGNQRPYSKIEDALKDGEIEPRMEGIKLETLKNFVPSGKTGRDGNNTWKSYTTDLYADDENRIWKVSRSGEERKIEQEVRNRKKTFQRQSALTQLNVYESGEPIVEPGKVLGTIYADMPNLRYVNLVFDGSDVDDFFTTMKKTINELETYAGNARFWTKYHTDKALERISAYLVGFGEAALRHNDLENAYKAFEMAGALETEWHPRKPKGAESLQG
ncbi:MAG: hypothetical protein QMD85_01805 [Candidatus Aenigmarchaeota archaeon]|nr:hypothetical protein [Candidatus Aenigmarchaeota archaeon]MDI6722288.1 hypothetical protein [Candidatus Aenigmarchaeota archaeon]